MQVQSRYRNISLAGDHQRTLILPEPWELGLDQPGSAGKTTLRRGGVFAALVVGVVAVIVAFGRVPLPAFPQFAVFHAGFDLLADAIVAFLLFEQFRYQRLASYAVLASAYLFSALITVPFVFSFPGALRPTGELIGGSQSSIWIWHIWHIGFPALVALSLLVHERADGATVAQDRTTAWVSSAVVASLSLVALATIAVTLFHNSLPILITRERVPLTPAFYIVGSIAAAMTLVALGLALRLAFRRTVLHVWLSVALTAFLADVAASLGAFNRYSVGWYFGRVESMVAAAILLLFLLDRIHTLYRQLTMTVDRLSQTNERLFALVDEKDGLVSALQRREEEIRHLAYHDPVTDIPNRRMLMEQLDLQLALSERYGHATALLFLDLDNFKEINDEYGHEVGDTLLRKIAASLTQCVRSVDTVSRFGGDEFVILLPEVGGVDDAIVVAKKILELLIQPMNIAQHVVRISTSIGIALSDQGSPRNAAELMTRADAAMYAAKQAGRNQYRLAR